MPSFLHDPLFWGACYFAVGLVGRALEAVGVAAKAPKLARVGRFLEAFGADTNKAGSDQ